MDARIERARIDVEVWRSLDRRLARIGVSPHSVSIENLVIKAEHRSRGGLEGFANVYVASRDCFSNLSKHLAIEVARIMNSQFQNAYKRGYGETRLFNMNLDVHRIFE